MVSVKGGRDELGCFAAKGRSKRQVGPVGGWY